ncbi:MAG: prephenate dehydratase [Thermoanaerobaculia bacterium]
MSFTVAFQGERGAFSEEAAMKLLGERIDVQPCRTFDDVFEAVRSGTTKSALVPIENSLAGSVHRNYELLGEAGLEIAAEVPLRISHHLIARPGTRRDDVRRVLSHPVALAQCQRFLGAWQGVDAVAEYDTAGSVRIVMEQGRDGEAAIAGRRAAEIWGGAILAEEIEDNPQNWTRFLLLARPDDVDAVKSRVAPGPLKTTVLFRTANIPGALFRALAVFALRDINLTKLESRPIEGRPWEYAFYADVGGDASEAPLANALGHLREMCERVVVLGSYASSRA